jgi:amino acid transporter
MKHTLLLFKWYFHLNSSRGIMKKLTKQLTFVGVIGMSIALMAPSAGMGLNTPFVAMSAGAASPFVFIISTIGIACVGAGFYRLTKRFNDSGSVYGITKAAIGPRYGFMAGWFLLLTYVVFIGTLLAGFATFADSLLSQVFNVNPPWVIMYLIGGAGVWILGYRKISLSAKVFLTLESVSIVLMLILALVIIFKGGAHGNSLSLRPFTPDGVSASSLGAALVFGFLTFIGFEGAAALGEESHNPSKAIPLALGAAVIMAGVIFTFVTYSQTIGYGVTASGIKAFSSAATPNTDLARTYLGNWATYITNFGAALSTFACALAASSGAGRVLFSLSRDERLSPKMSEIHPIHMSPHKAHNISMAIGLLAALVFVPFTDSPSNVYGWLGALATLAVILAYGMTSIASFVFFAKDDWKSKKFWNFIPTLIAIPLLAYTFKAQILPIPPNPLRWFPYVILGYTLIGIGVLYSQRKRTVSRAVAYDELSSDNH